MPGDKQADPPPGMGSLVLEDAIKYDGNCYYVNFETPSPIFLSSICNWLESARPGLEVTRLVPGHLSAPESSEVRDLHFFETEEEELEWVLRIEDDGTQSFLMTAMFEWRGSIQSTLTLGSDEKTSSA